MPSDERIRAVRAAARDGYARYETAIGTALDQVRAFLRSRREQTDASIAVEAGATLGAFAQGRVDAARFAALTHRDRSISTVAAGALERSAQVLTELLDRGDAAFVNELPRGGEPGDAAFEAFALVGRAFGAVLVARAVKSSVYSPEQHDRHLRSFPFAKWNSVERRLTPPVVLSVDGEDLRVGSLSEYLDGSQKLVLVVRGRCAPAPLARLITPGVFVQQACTVDELSAFYASDAPGIAALVPETSARFSHDPARGRSPAERIVVAHRPTSEPRAWIGGASAWQQADELAHLDALATATERQSAIASVDGKRDPAAALTEWLVAQSGLTGVEDER
ncbi:MAG TPA: hypothetical protein VFZ21_02525 [Gemmatimonadaceae bacterium]|nr:hypothetical protein [Gemmatimonadaceae bacterium]